MKRKLIKRNKQFLSKTMGKYTGWRSFQRTTLCNYVGENFEDFMKWLQMDNRKHQWSYEWCVSKKVIKAIDAHLKDNYEEISLDDY